MCKGEVIIKKILQAGDTKSLEVCGKQHQYQNGQEQTEGKRKENVMCHMSHVRCHVSCVMCHMSGVTFHLSPITCHLSQTVTATATDPPPAYTPIMHSRLVCKDPQNLKNVKSQKIIELSKTGIHIEVCQY